MNNNNDNESFRLDSMADVRRDLLQSQPHVHLGQGYGSVYATDHLDSVHVLDGNLTKFLRSFLVARIDESEIYRLAYLEERYEWLNKNAFDGRLKKPTLTTKLGRQSILGCWFARKEMIAISPQLFKLKDESVLLGTLIHEMAHQYETQHSPRPVGEDAHGTTWQLIMISLGLTIRKSFYGSLAPFKKPVSVEVGKDFEIVFGNND